MKLSNIVFVLLLFGCVPQYLMANEPAKSPNEIARYVDDAVFIRLINRTPDQLKAFYIARKFNDAAINEILSTCFVTPIIHNRSDDILWLDLDEWQFTIDEQSFNRLKRDDWTRKWKTIGLPRAQQSTFGWTLLPETRDLHPDESVGGSFVIPYQKSPFSVHMNFPVGADKKGQAKTLTFKGIQCLKN
jgi:hypothetical protein